MKYIYFELHFNIILAGIFLICLKTFDIIKLIKKIKILWYFCPLICPVYIFNQGSHQFLFLSNWLFLLYNGLEYAYKINISNKSWQFSSRLQFPVLFSAFVVLEIKAYIIHGRALPFHIRFNVDRSCISLWIFEDNKFIRQYHGIEKKNSAINCIYGTFYGITLELMFVR